jgi:hypothetical protein
MYLLLLLGALLSLDAGASPAAHPTVDGHSRELAESARRAAGILAERHQGPGYWLTAHTVEARFQAPSPELNTFTNAVMIDILDPVAKDAGIAGVLGRTRAFLANQIEADGLVRYHGLPDAPTMWKLGCVITPDSDDTALVWRISPGANRELLARALATLGQFRTTDGLYRTWLAPQDRYKCIDPGRDPNPADIAIQMHVLMLLAQVDAPAALALCAAVSRRSSDDDVWVYYGKAPLIPMLRLADLHKVGCPLNLPQSRLETTVPGQGVWLEVVRLLDRMERGQPTAPEHSRAAALLRQLATDGFSLTKGTPPLLYHNDFTASVRRFYWSEDVGYALWLRLYFASQRAWSKQREPVPM